MSISLPANVLAAPPLVHRPDGRNDSMPRSESSTANAVYTQTDHSGMYEVTVDAPSPRTEWFAVNVDPVESDLSGLSEQEIEADVLAGIESVYLTDWQDVVRGAETIAAEQSGLSWWLLAAALGLLLVEQTMAWDFRYGNAALGVTLLTAVTAGGFAWHAWLGIGLLTALTAGMVTWGLFGRRGGHTGRAEAFRP